MMFLFTALTMTAASAGIAYCGFSVWAGLEFYFRKRDVPPRDFTPPVSILKPLCGIDPNGYESLRSHCVQDYPEYEIIFGVSTPEDPAVSAVENLKQEFPHLPIALVVCPNVSGTNLKVSNILQMLPAARYNHLLINDSDISVPRDYLRRVIGPLQDRSVGIVTCLFRGLAPANIGARLESIAIEADFVPGVLIARRLEGGIRFAMGSTMAFHRDVLERIGGLNTIADYLADDYEFGRRDAQNGLRVELADCLVDHHLPPYSLSEFFQHQLRWARTIRSCRPGGYLGMVLTFALPWSVLAVATAPTMFIGWALVFVSLAMRIMVMLISGLVVLRDRRVFRSLWLLPVRDFVTPLIWLASYTGTAIVWRGNKFDVTDGKLRPV